MQQKHKAVEGLKSNNLHFVRTLISSQLPKMKPSKQIVYPSAKSRAFVVSGAAGWLLLEAMLQDFAEIAEHGQGET